MTAAIIIGAVLAAAVLAAGTRVLSKAARLERLIEKHDRAEADLEAMTLPEDRACGCRWLPCDEHLSRLERIIRKDGEQR